METSGQNEHVLITQTLSEVPCFLKINNLKTQHKNIYIFLIIPTHLLVNIDQTLCNVKKLQLSSFMLGLFLESCSEYFSIFIAGINCKLKQRQMGAYQRYF